MTGTPVPELADAPTTFRWEGDRLLVHASGVRPPTWVLDLIQRIGTAIGSRPTRSLLADLSGVTGPISDLDRLSFAQAAARWPKIPCATVFHPRMADPRRFGESVAQNRGLNLRVFTDLTEARAWIDREAPIRYTTGGG
jgi:hypothetical protein